MVNVSSQDASDDWDPYGKYEVTVDRLASDHVKPLLDLWRNLGQGLGNLEKFNGEEAAVKTQIRKTLQASVDAFRSTKGLSATAPINPEEYRSYIEAEANGQGMARVCIFKLRQVLIEVEHLGLGPLELAKAKRHVFESTEPANIDWTWLEKVCASKARTVALAK